MVSRFYHLIGKEDAALHLESCAQASDVVENSHLLICISFKTIFPILLAALNLANI
jgi:hypothetical protein